MFLILLDNVVAINRISMGVRGPKRSEVARYQMIAASGKGRFSAMRP